ncbi:hypothetical protein BC830DRAFT_1220923 [Chytriomyces sp. MP71]|nr:hypothetical protein BC830DRAFT_1220923 [Chytriomyces sp. MP71]
MYKTDITTCSEFLNFFIGLVFEGRQGASESVKREIVVKSGKVWRGLADSIPDEEAGNKLSQRERKLNASKREEMLRVWNDYKARNDSDYSNPYLESTYANPMSSSSSSSSAMATTSSAGNKPSSPSQSVRVLSIKSKATHQRNTPMWNAMSKGKGFVSSLEDSKKQSPVFDMGGGSSSRSSSVSTEFRSGFTPQSETSGGSAQWGGSGSSGAQPRKTVASEFPGLPSRPVSKVPPYFKKDAAPVPAVDAWTAGAGGSSGGVDVYNPEENQGSGGKKKKKEKIVLMKVGL